MYGFSPCETARAKPQSPLCRERAPSAFRPTHVVTLPASSLVSLVFVFSTGLALVLFVRAVPRRPLVAGVLVAWALRQLAIAWTGFYTVTRTLPPRFVLAIGPPLLTLVLMVALRPGRAWLASFDLRAVTLLHVVRLPVEWGLHQLYVEGYVPEVMTWEGRNFDVVSGVTAPLVAWLAFRGGVVRRPLLLAWNLLCLGLLGIIVFHGILSVPTPLQQFGFEPNVALMYPPFVWLPAVIVPLVLTAHIAAVIRLTRRTRGTPGR